MSTIHENILSLCDEAGIKAGKMCSDLGMSRSLVTDLKAGRKNGITAETAQKIADYFGVSVERVINGKEAIAEKAPRDEQLKFALFGGGEGISDEMLDEVLQFAQMVKLREDQKKKKG